MTWAVISLGPLLGTAAQPLSRFIINVVGSGVLYGGVSAALAAGTVALARRAPAELTRGPLLDHKELVGRRTDGPENQEDELTGQNAGPARRFDSSSEENYLTSRDSAARPAR